MGIPLNQALSIGAYVMGQHLRGRKRYPLVLMLEPLFRCNLACAGCGKIDYPDKILNQRISVADALHSMDECGAPVVVLAGGEPLLHKELPRSSPARCAKANSSPSARTRCCWKKRSIFTSRTAASIGRSISMATRRCTTSRSVKKASTTGPSRPSKPPRPKASASTSIARYSAMPSLSASRNFFDNVKALGIDGITDFAGLRL